MSSHVRFSHANCTQSKTVYNQMCPKPLDIAISASKMEAIQPHLINDVCATRLRFFAILLMHENFNKKTKRRNRPGYAQKAIVIEQDTVTNTQGPTKEA